MKDKDQSFSDTDFKMGDMVILSDDEHLVKSEFCLSKFRWNDQMRLMLGKKFPIAAIRDRQTVALPSPHGSQKDKWYFPKSLVTKASGMKFYFNSESDPES